MQTFTQVATKQSTHNSFKSRKPEGIKRYYTRTRQGSHGNSYYVEPSETCPIDILQDKRRFVVLTFDKADDYIVVNSKRYYLNSRVAIKCTDKVDCRVAVVDLAELKKQKSYDWDSSYKHKHTLIVGSFAQLEAEAERQYSFNGCPYVEQRATYIPDKNARSYTFIPSFQVA